MMEVQFRYADETDSALVAQLVITLTEEICQRTNARHFDIDLEGTTRQSRELIASGGYRVILAVAGSEVVAMSAISETYALYAGGKVAVIQEFWVDPRYRSEGIGSRLIAQVRQDAQHHGCACIELCTPPLPEFDNTLAFYQRQGLAPVGGRKMRGGID